VCSFANIFTRINVIKLMSIKALYVYRKESSVPAARPLLCPIVIFPIFSPIDIHVSPEIIRETRKCAIVPPPRVYFDASAEVLYRPGNFIRAVKFILLSAGRVYARFYLEEKAVERRARARTSLMPRGI